MAEKRNANGKWIILFVASFVLVAAALWYVGLRRQAEQGQGAETAREFKVAYLPIYVDLPLFVAVEEGLFKKRGLNVSLQRFESSPDMSAALLSGRVDAVASIATPTALSVENRDPSRFRIFMVDQATEEAPLSSLILPKGSTVTEISGLRGKIVGSFPGPTATTLAPLAFAVDGLSTSDFRLVDIPPGNHLELLNSGTIDALITYEPTATQAVMKNGATRLVSGFIESRLMDPWPAGSWLISTSKLDTPEERAASELFSGAIYEATDMLRANPEEMKVHLAKYMLIDQDVALNAPNIAFTKSGEADAGALQGYADLLFKENFIDRPVATQELLFVAGN